jgi:hypothetical protein
MTYRVTFWSCCVISLPALTGCSLFHEDTQYNPVIDPAQFVKVVDNPYFPLVPGTTYHFRSTSDEGVDDIVVTVTSSNKVIAGVTTTVVHDVATRGTQLREDTWDWYAQDRDGNVWYFGEDTKEYERGKVSTEGSWQTGVKGAKPGIVMPAHPSVGQMNRQEYLVGEAEDEGQIIALDETVTVAAGTFKGVLEHKYYAPGVGVVAEATVEGGTEKVELVSK